MFHAIIEDSWRKHITFSISFSPNWLLVLLFSYYLLNLLAEEFMKRCGLLLKTFSKKVQYIITKRTYGGSKRIGRKNWMLNLMKFSNINPLYSRQLTDKAISVNHVHGWRFAVDAFCLQLPYLSKISQGNAT